MLYQSCWNNLVTGLIVPSSLLQFVNSLFQTCSNKFGTSSANTSCQQLVNRLVTTCLQVCSNLCVFTCVGVSIIKNLKLQMMIELKLVCSQRFILFDHMSRVLGVEYFCFDCTLKNQSTESGAAERDT